MEAWTHWSQPELVVDELSGKSMCGTSRHTPRSLTAIFLRKNISGGGGGGRDFYLLAENFKGTCNGQVGKNLKNQNL